MGKIDGQIWIEKIAPFKLKYHVEGKDFAVETSEEYLNIVEGTTVGCLVKINKDGALEKANFPVDLRNVIGMLTSSTGTVSRSGYVSIPSDYVELGVLPGDSIYWLDTDTYTHSIANTEDIAYHNLPLVGTVVSVDTENKTIVIHLNLASFDTTIEWSATRQISSESAEISIPHGLKLADYTKNSLKIDGNLAIATSSYDNSNGTTTFYVNPHNTNLHTYTLSGSVIYGK